MSKEATIERIGELAVIATIRAPSPAAALDTAAALIEGGISCLEITFTTPDAPAAIASAIERFGSSALIGAGTIRSRSDTEAAIAAGAEFLVSPGLESDAAEAMTASSRAAIIGALTPTEVMSALIAGADLVKLFPSSLGGTGYMKSLRGPFPDVRFVPTGGIGPLEVTEFLGAGAVAVGAGSELCPSKAIAAGDFAQVTELARKFAAAIPASGLPPLASRWA